MKSCYVESDLDGAKTMKNWIYMFVFPFIFFYFPFRINLLSVPKHCVRYYMVRLSYKIGSTCCMQNRILMFLSDFTCIKLIIDDYKIGSTKIQFYMV
jgi:hypothetical protein